MSTNFQSLLDTLNGVSNDADALAKSFAEAPPAEKPAVAPGAGEGGEAGEGEDDEAIAAAAAEAEAAAKKGKTDEPFGKSFEFVDADGTKQEAVDATELVKSMLSRLDASDDNLAKAMTAITGVMQKQTEMLKAQGAKIAELSGQGRGRRTMLMVNEKPNLGDTMAKSQAADEGSMTPDVFFAKANTAFDQNKISGKDLNVISVSLRSNHPIEEALIKKVMAV